MLIPALLPLVLLCAPAPAADEIRAILANRIDENKKAVGIVVATIDEKGREVIARGSVAKDRNAVPDADTVFEIGSLTKVFTSLLLADMVERGEVKLEDPVAKYLPETVKVPERSARRITLADLSMHISGLPRVPNNLRAADLANPYADYDAPKLYEFLSGYTLTRDIGATYSYSNLGAGLLGHALERRAGIPYEQLLRRRIFEPLGMASTSITLSADQKKRLAAGYNTSLAPAKNWDFQVLAGCGALRSTANDLLRFVAANLDLTDTSLKSAMRRMRSVRKDTGTPDLEIALGWHILKRYGTEIVWHNGGTFGYRSFAGFAPSKKRGVVVLVNTFHDCDDIGLHLLEPQYKVAKFEAAKSGAANERK